MSLSWFVPCTPQIPWHSSQQNAPTSLITSFPSSPSAHLSNTYIIMRTSVSYTIETSLLLIIAPASWERASFTPPPSPPFSCFFFFSCSIHSSPSLSRSLPEVVVMNSSALASDAHQQEARPFSTALLDQEGKRD